MKQGKSIFTRLLALTLALVLIVSNANLGLALTVFAESENKVTSGELVAENYALTDAEKALLTSGYLVEDTYEYNVPSDTALVAVDTDNKTISAAKFENWVATTAEVVVGGEVKETLTLTDGKATYTYGGNAFAVKVEYVLTQEVANQETLLKAGFNLKAAIEHINAVTAASDGNAGTVVMAMPSLMQLTGEGIAVDTGYVTLNFALTAAASDAVIALNEQVTTNESGELDLQDVVAAHKGTKSELLLSNGAATKKVIDETYANLKTLAADQIMTDVLNETSNLYKILNQEDPDSLTKLQVLASQIGSLVSALEPVAKATWDFSGLKAGGAELDALVAALGEKSAVTVKNPLDVATAYVQANLSMFNVTVAVKLQNVEDKADSDVLVENETVKTVVLTLAKDATKAEILAELANTTVEADAKAAWGEAYVDGQYEATATDLPETLTEDITYTITYAPKTYTLDYCGEEKNVHYGYQVTLEKHSDAAQAYDYTVNGNKMSQGSVYTVVGDTTVARESGKAYSGYGLYSTIADNYANDVLKAILTSGALNGDTTLYLRKPDAADADSLLKLSKGTLTAVAEYEADYANLSWVPYTYGAEGTENKFNGAVEVAMAGDEAKAIYRLTLTNYSEDAVKEILNTAIGLKTEAAAQISTLNRLAAYLDQMAQLDKTKLGAMNGVIDVTDFDTDPEKNAAMRAELKGIVGNIINNNLDGNVLKINNMLIAYNEGGLTYYYNNADAVIAEINSLSGYLSSLLETEEKKAALVTMTTAAGYPEYADKIADLEEVISGVKADLTAPNKMINLQSANLYKLIEALNAEGAAEATGSGYPYINSVTLSVTGEGLYQVIVKVFVGGKEQSFASPSYYVGNAVVADDIDKIITDAEAFAVSVLGDTKYYTVKGLDELKALAGQKLEEKVAKELTYVVKETKVVVDGGAETVVSAEKRSVILPKHAVSGYVYEYTTSWDGATYKPEQTDIEIILTDAQLDAIFAGKNTVARTEIHQAAEDLEDKVDGASTLQFNEDMTALVATVGADNMMQFATELSSLGYTDIKLNGEDFMYMNEENTLQISVQTLVNAILNDNTFGTKKLIALDPEKGGELFTAKMDLGEDFKGMDFTMKLKSVPAQMQTAISGMNAVKNYMSFQSNNGDLHVTLNLPEKVYELYLTALIATGNVDLNDVNAVNNKIAFTFLYDYIEYIAGTEADAQTFQNTLEMLSAGDKINVTAYSKYYDLAKKALTAEGMKISYSDNVEANLTAAGAKSINALMGLLGVPADTLDMAKGMIAEYRDGANLNVTVTASLTDTTEAYDFEAVVIDLSAAKAGAADIKNGGKAGINTELAKTLLKGEGIANGIDFTSDLPARLEEVNGESIIVLLADVDGDLYFNDGAILDLNGKTVNGDITANGGNLIITDSTLATFEAGTVNGAVNGSVHILAGKYTDDVEAFLKDGYKVTDGYVHNALYWIEGTNDDMTIVLNSDYMYEACVEGYLPSVTAIAAEIAADLSTKYLIPAAVSVDGYSVYNLNFNKLITLLKSETTVKDAANMLIDCIDVDQLKGLANAILDDLTDLNGIYNALKTNAEIGDYTYKTAPWKVVVEYVADGDYIDFSIGANHEMAKSTTIGLSIAGDNIVKLMELICELRDITSIDVNVDLKKPTYNDESKTLSMAGSAAVAAEFNLFNSCTYKNTDYITIFTVLFANAGAENADAMVAALNKEDYDAVKDAFDEMTVRDVFEAMKALDRPDDFVELAAQVGVTLDVTAADRLESLYHLFIVAFGKAFEKIEDGTVNNAADKVVDKVIDATDSDRIHGAIDKVTDKVTDKVGSDKLANAVDKVNGKLEDKVTTENLNNAYGKVTNRIDAFLQNYAVSNLDKKLGALDTDDDGTYELSLTATKRADATVRGYTADVNIEKISISLKVIIFDNDCLWGDVNHDGKVTPFDADLILKYYAELDPADFVCAKKADVNCDGKITPYDADLVLKYYAELISELPYIEE